MRVATRVMLEFAKPDKVNLGAYGGPINGVRGAVVKDQAILAVA